MTGGNRNIQRTVALSGVLVALTLAAYWPVLGHGFVAYDDGDYVTQNAQVQAGLTWEGVVWAFRSGEAANWHPLTWLSHMLDAQLYGLSPVGHHLTSLLLHLANTLLLFLLLRALTGREWPSAFVAGLFALHPLHVESVAWVAERKDVLSAFFFLLTLAAYASYASARTGTLANTVAPGAKSLSGKKPLASPVAPPSPARARRFYVLALVLFVLGLMSKPMVVTLPCVLLLLDWWPLRRMEFSAGGGVRKTLLPLLLEKVPFLVLTALSSTVTMLVQQGAATSWKDYGLSQRLANAMASYAKYLGKAFWPIDLSIFYPHPFVNRADRWSSGQIVLAVLFLAAVSGLALWRARREGWFLVGWFWYLGMLVPVIGIFQVGGQAMADRYTYLPLIGIFIGVVWGLDHWLSRSRQVATIIGVLAILACAGLTRRQVTFWQDDFALFEHALTVNERNATAHGNLALAFTKKGDYERALKHCQAALEADPSDWLSWHVKGAIDVAMGKPQEAIRNFETALRWRPESAETWFQLGDACANLSMLPDAIDHYRAALRLKPDMVAAHNNLGVAFVLQGRRDEAAKEFTEAARLDPKAPDKYYNLGTTLADSGKFKEAEAPLTEAVRLRPDYVEALAALAGVLTGEGRAAESEARLRDAERLCPNTAEARFKLGNALLTSGFTNQSAVAFAAAARLEPNLAKALLNAAQSLLEHGQFDDALARLRAVVRLEPGNAEGHERLGLLLASQQKLGEAAPHLQEAAHLTPNAETHYNLGLVLGMQGRLAEALANYRRALQEKPDSAPTLNDIAWILATAPQAELRNGAEAVALAERASRSGGSPNPRFLGTLAAAYAEAGRFAEAVSTVEKTRDLAQAAGDKSLAELAASRLELYRKQQAYRQ